MPVLRQSAWVLADVALEDIVAVVRRRSGSEIPTLGHFKQLVACSLAATLRPYEGRLPQFRLLLAPPAECGDAILIHQEALSPDRVRDLAPIATRSMFLGVWPMEGQLVLWGATSMPAVRPRLSLAAFQPGSVVVRVGHETVACYRQLERDLTLAERRDDDPGVGGARVHATYLLGRSVVVADEGWTWLFGAILFLVADATRRHGSGGTILVLPTNDPSDDLNVRFLASPDSRADHLMSAVDSLSKDAPQDLDEFWRIYRDPQTVLSRRLRPILENRPWEVDPVLMHASSAFGDLSAVDGAVVLKRDLSLFGFGAVIDTASMPDDSIHQLSVLDSMAGERPAIGNIADLGGTRRRSATRFVLKNKGATAIVVSHDGGISVTSWCLPDAPPNRPLVMRDLELLW